MVQKQWLGHAFVVFGWCALPFIVREWLRLR